jgi:hypothetical protein
MAGNGAKANEDVELPGIPVDGQFYTVEDLTGREQRELRDALRELTGNDTATIAAFLNFAMVDDFDYACAMTYVVTKRTNEKFTLDDALELKPAEIQEAGRELLKEQRRRPRKPAGSSES